jgi:hypothetical protein
VKVLSKVAALSVVFSMIFSVAAGASITKERAGKQYLADVAPVNAALTKFGIEAGKWTNLTTVSFAESQATPVIKDLRKLQNLLLSQSWPRGARADLRVLYTAISPLEAYLLELSTLSGPGSGTWSSSFIHDATTLASDVGFVRHDLGLPPN